MFELINLLSLLFNRKLLVFLLLEFLFLELDGFHEDLDFSVADSRLHCSFASERHVGHFKFGSVEHFLELFILLYQDFVFLVKFLFWNEVLSQAALIKFGLDDVGALILTLSAFYGVHFLQRELELIVRVSKFFLADHQKLLGFFQLISEIVHLLFLLHEK